MAEIPSITQAPNRFYQLVSSAPRWLYRQVVYYTPSAIKEYPLTFQNVDRIASIGIISLVLVGCIFKGYKWFFHSRDSELIPAEEPTTPAILVPPRSNSAEALKDEILQFYSEFDFEKYLYLLIGDRGRHINARFKNLLNGLSNIAPNDQILGNLKSHLEERYQLFLGMRSKRMQLYRIPLEVTEHNQIVVPGKGNCFYESVVRLLGPGINQLASTNEEVTLINPDELRENVVDWMRHHLDDSELRTQIQNVIWTAVMDADDRAAELQQTITMLQKEEGDTATAEAELAKNRADIRPYQDHADQVTKVDPIITAWLLKSVPKLNMRNGMRQMLNDALMGQREDNRALLAMTRLPAETFASSVNVEKELTELRVLYDPCRTSCYQAIDNYLNRQAEDQVWAANAEAYAVAQMYQCGVNIICVERQGDQDVRDPNLNSHYLAFPERQKCLTLKYITNLHHYELFGDQQ